MHNLGQSHELVLRVKGERRDGQERELTVA